MMIGSSLAARLAGGTSDRQLWCSVYSVHLFPAVLLNRDGPEPVNLKDSELRGPTGKVCGKEGVI